MIRYKIGLKNSKEGALYLYFLPPGTSLGGEWISTTFDVLQKRADTDMVEEYFKDLRLMFGEPVQRISDVAARMRVPRSSLAEVLEEFRLNLLESDSAYNKQSGL